MSTRATDAAQPGHLYGVGVGPGDPSLITLRAAREGDPRRPRPGQRFRMGARVFPIEAVAEADGAGLWLDCVAREERLS